MPSVSIPQAALDRKWHIFPVRPNSKLPYKDFSWPAQATNDPEFLAEVAATGVWPNRDPFAGDDSPRHWDVRGCNWARSTGDDGDLIVDLDIKRDASGAVIENGFDTWKKITAFYGDPGETLTVRTPGKGTDQEPDRGCHIVFRGEAGSTQRKLGPGVDIKSVGGYVLIPGSKINGREYELAVDAEAIQPPSWLITKLSEPTVKDPRRDEPAITLDLEHNVAWAIRYLASDAPPAIQGMNGDDTTYAVAVRVRGRGISEAKTLELMLDHWNTRCAPPWTPEELARKVANAERYAQNRAGAESPDAMFGPSIELGEKDEPPDWLIQASRISVMKIPPRQWVLGRRFIKRYVTVTTAPGGVGKSMLATVEGVAVAAGQELTGEKVFIPGPVVIYNAEDPRDELERRLAGIMLHYKMKPEDMANVYAFSGHDQRVLLAGETKDGIQINENGVAAFIRFIKKLGAVLVVLDPFIRLHRCNENSNNAIDEVARVLSHRIAKEGDCAVHVVHHSRKLGKEGGNGDAETARGASSLVSAVRVAHTLGGMSEKEAKDFGLVGLHRQYVRLDGAKANLAPAEAAAIWFKKESVNLGQGDFVGVLERVELTKCEGVEDEDALIQEVCSIMPAGETRTLHEIAQQLKKESLIPGSENTIKANIERAFKTAIKVEGYVYRICRKKGQTGGMAKALVCEEEA